MPILVVTPVHTECSLEHAGLSRDRIQHDRQKWNRNLSYHPDNRIFATPSPKMTPYHSYMIVIGSELLGGPGCKNPVTSEGAKFSCVPVGALDVTPHQSNRAYID